MRQRNGRPTQRTHERVVRTRNDTHPTLRRDRGCSARTGRAAHGLVRNDDVEWREAMPIATPCERGQRSTGRCGENGRPISGRCENRRPISPNAVSWPRSEPTGHIPRPRRGLVVPAFFRTLRVRPLASAVQPFGGSAHKVWASRSRGHSRCPCPAAGVHRWCPPRGWSGGRPSRCDARPPQFPTLACLPLRVVSAAPRMRAVTLRR